MKSPRSSLIAGAFWGLASAALFGISAPLAKLLLPRLDAWILAGLLYVGAGVGLTVVRLVQRIAADSPGTRRDRLRWSDTPLLTAIAVTGGGFGPVLLLFGLQRMSGVAGALLLNLESVFTMFLALTIFGERISRREAVAALTIIAGGVVISTHGGLFRAESVGAGAIAAACLAWAVDNNLTARLSHRDALAVVQFKTLTAGAGNLALALTIGRPLPDSGPLVLSLLVGFICYGLSIVFDVYALRYLGAARESAVFATAPFAGALAAVPLLGEHLAARELAGGFLMAVGVAALIVARRRMATK